jgi:hypothetical protein
MVLSYSSYCRTFLLFGALGCATAALPAMRYQYTSFATTAPEDAAAFCSKYFDAQPLTPDQFETHRNVPAAARVSAVRFHYHKGGAALHHDVYFIADDSKPAGPMSVGAYEEYLENIHRFDVTETWDWFQDWHLCLAAPGGDVDGVAARLLRDGVPFVTRSHYSLYVQIPHGITFQVLGDKMARAWTENFNFCRRTDGAFHAEAALRAQPMALPTPAPAPGALRAAPAGAAAAVAPLELPPSHHSYFSSAPDAAFNFTLAHTSGAAYNMSVVWQSSHEYSDGRCALLRWVQYESYQIHFVDQFSKYQGEGVPGAVSVPDVEKYLGALHGNMSAVDAYMDFRVGWQVDDLAPYAASLAAAGSEFLALDASDAPLPDGAAVQAAASLRMQLPGGIIFELAKA